MATHHFDLASLEKDYDFFNDLKNGNFVLVLGAGFSYGIDEKNRLKNRTNHDNPLYQSIPTTDDFIKITEVEFGRTGIDFQTSASLWENAIDTDKEKAELFRNLFLLNKDDFNKRHFAQYKAILLPNWYRVFTFNFDNVFELICRNGEYRTLSYPDDKEFSSNLNRKELAHVHGSVTETSNIKDLVFFGDKYALLHDSNNDLYHALLNAVNMPNQRKHIIIVGCKFNEIIQIQKFYNRISQEYKPKIFQFDIKEPLLSSRKDRFDYKFIKASTFDFLQFLKANKSKIKNVLLDGAVTINEDFIKKINEGRAFSKSKFYSGEQEDDCQWYGVLHGFDVKRKDYNEIKLQAITAFNNPVINKVAAIIHGTGGCGKTTLLRRLAIELCLETEFEVIWVKDRQLKEFKENAIEKIRSDNENKYMVFIEDWYRLADGEENRKLGDELLKDTQSIANIRLIIGDRDITGKDYLLNLNNKESIFGLKQAENKEIIRQIIDGYSEWENAAHNILNENSYNSPLFIILFVIAGINERRMEPGDTDFSDLEIIARQIGKYDLKKIALFYPGLAMALHYWACVYKKYKIFITYPTFLKLADYFNKDNVISACFTNWDANSEILNKLKLYINVNKNESLKKRLQHLNLIQFNHDKLAEDILANVELQNWETYDDIVKKKLLQIITDHGDAYSASVLSGVFLSKEIQLFSNDNERTALVDKLFNERANRWHHYLTPLAKFGLNASSLYKYIEVLGQEKRYHHILWLQYFHIASIQEKTSAARKILTDENIVSIPPGIVVAAFNQPGNDAEKAAAAKNILQNENIVLLPSFIVAAAFKQLGNDAEKTAAAKKILQGENIVSIQPEILVAAFNQPGNDAEKAAAAKNILQNENIVLLPSFIVAAAFKQLGNDAEKAAAAKKILQSENIVSIPPGIVVAAFNQPGNDAEKTAAAKKILQSENIVSIIHHIVVAAFNQPGNDAEKAAAAKNILQNENIVLLPSFIVAAAFKQLGNDAEKAAVAKNILQSENIVSIQPEIVVAAFNQPGNDAEKAAAAKKILQSENIVSIPPGIVVAAFNQPGNDAEKTAAAKKILQSENIVSIIHHIVVAAFNQPGNDAEKAAAAKNILQNENIVLLPSFIVAAAFKQLGNDAEKAAVAKNILQSENIVSIQPEIVVAAFNQPGNGAEKAAAAKNILKYPYWNNPRNLFTVISALNYCSSQRIPPHLVKERIGEIIDNYFKTNRLKVDGDFYFLLLRIPFHQDKLWKDQTVFIIKNWYRVQRRGINNVLYSYRNFPNKIENVCKNIMENWEIEVDKPIKMVYGKPHKGNHIRLSLGHPNLKHIAKRTAIEMEKALSVNPDIVPSYLANIARQIIYEDKFPEWDLDV